MALSKKYTVNVDLTTQDSSVYVASVRLTVTNVVGVGLLTGPAGPQGATGATGATGPAGTPGVVQSVNGISQAAVVLDQDDIGDGTTYKQYSQTEKTKLAGIETAADVTDAANVTAAGAFMKSVDDMDDITDGTTYKKYSAAEKTKLAAIEALADVTDAANVTAAGAFMKSVDDTDDITTGSTNKFATAAEKAKLANITVTQAVDLDTIETNANNVPGIKTKTDFISVTQAVDLDQMETDIAALSGGMVYKGNWDASAGTFPGAGAAKIGGLYYVSVAGTVDGVSFAVGDNIVATVNNASATTYASNWSKHDQTDAVSSVAGKVGAVTLVAADLTDITATATELNYTDGVTSPIQTQLNAKQASDQDLTDISALTPSNDDFMQRKAGAWANRTVAQVKTDLAISNVDNTSDANKPVSTATQTALNLKLDSSAYDDATAAETNTGASSTKYVSPDGLAGSYAGTKVASIYAIEAATVVTTGDGKAYLRINSDLNGMNLVSVSIAVITTSSSGLPTVQLARGRQSSTTSAHSFVDMLSTKVTIDATEYDSKDATTAAVIDAANDDVATGDLIRIDVDVAGTGAAGLILTMAFRLP